MKQEMEVAGTASSSTTGSAASRQGMAGQLSIVLTPEVHSFCICQILHLKEYQSVNTELTSLPRPAATTTAPSH